MSNYTKNSYVKDINTPWFKLIQHITQGSAVLDVGCSSGHLGEAIKQETQSSVVGVEIDAEDVKRATKLLDEVYTVNLETEPIPEKLASKKFDYIVFCDVIEHFVWPAQTLAKIKRLLKPEGKILFSIPNMAHMSVRLMLLEGRFEYGETGLLDKTHLHYYDDDEIHRVFQEAGYTIDVFDWVSRDMPAEVLKSRLQKIGLTPTDKFITSSHDIAAGAYQYVGVASIAMTKKIPKKRNYVSPSVQDVEKYVRMMQEQVEAINNEMNALALKLEETEIYARGLQEEIKQLQKTISFRIKRKSKSLFTKVKK